ncbi:hypothetical protein SLE2022_051510 [Rubroshorea leprosula]
MDKSSQSQAQNISYEAGQAKGKTEEKAGGMTDKASEVAQSAKDSIADAGGVMMAEAQGAAEAVKNSTDCSWQGWLNDLIESNGGKKKFSSSKSLFYEAPLGYSIEDVQPCGGIEKFRSAAYSNCIRKPS